LTPAYVIKWVDNKIHQKSIREVVKVLKGTSIVMEDNTIIVYCPGVSENMIKTYLREIQCSKYQCVKLDYLAERVR
jgi:hypothetical protein